MRICVLPHRRQDLIRLSFQPMSATDNMQDAIQRSKNERNTAKGILADVLEPSRRSQEHSGQPESDNDPMTGFQDSEPAE